MKDTLKAVYWKKEEKPMTDNLSIADLKNEEWREVKNFNNYKISNYGRLKKINKDGSEKICKQQSTEKGYKFCKLEAICKKHKVRIHLLVAEAFFNIITDNVEIKHKNGIVWDNRVDNLKYIE